MRILVGAAVIVAHALLIFAAEPRYHLKSAEPSALASALYEGLRIGTLAIFFVLAGWAAVTSLRRRSAVRFLQERVVRVLVPLFAGIFLLGPAIKFIELGQGRDMRLGSFRLVPPRDQEFWAFLLRYPSHFDLVTWSHLWFLAYLFLISLLLLPLLRHLARRAPEAAVPPRALLYAPALVMAGLLAASGGYWPFLPGLVNDGANFAHFALCFTIGAGLAAWPGFEAGLRAEMPRMLALAAAGFAGVLWFGESTAGRLCVGLAAWGMIAAAFGLAARWRPAPGRLLDYLGEAVMPIYVLHHLPLLLLGLAILPLAWPVGVKVAAIALATTIVSFASYQWLVRPFALPRRLVGLGPFVRPAAVAVAAAPA